MLRIDYIDSIVSAIREEEEKEGKKDESDSEPDEIEELTNPNSKKNGDKKKKADQKKEAKSKKKTVAVTDEDKENERTIFLQRGLLDYLAGNSCEPWHQRRRLPT